MLHFGGDVNGQSLYNQTSKQNALRKSYIFRRRNLDNIVFAKIAKHMKPTHYVGIY